jgi:glycosyltransferase involved in cell wall biosynthesis
VIAPVPPVRGRLLYLCLENPWHLNAGGLIRNYWLIRALAERFDVDLVTGGDPAAPVPWDFEKFCASIRRYPSPGSLSRLARALRPDETLFTAGSVSRAMRVAVAELLRRTAYAAIVLDLNMIGAIPRSCTVPLVYNAHNCETALLRRRWRTETSLARRLATALDAVRLRPIESRVIERAVLVAACSSADVEDLGTLARIVRAKAVVVPNGVDTARYAPLASVRPEPGTVLVTGSFDWHPNRIGLRWFLREVVPALRAFAVEPLQVRVAGRMDAALAAEIDAVPGVSAVPNVPDMRDELGRAQIVAAPILASSGTRLRILEAWAAARPVVTTPEGALGLAHRDGADLLVRSGAAPFAQGIAELLREPERRDALAAAGLRRANGYDWHGIGAELLDACAAASLG